MLFGKHARDWIEERPELRPKTIQLYTYLLRSHIAPALGARSLSALRNRADRARRRGRASSSLKSAWPQMR
ncbi:MAG: hypothetical protein JO037_15255 [Actinobacteria bacterium]|nr:hypothetical protein [Actinomycetota bacterium]